MFSKPGLASIPLMIIDMHTHHNMLLHSSGLSRSMMLLIPMAGNCKAQGERSLTGTGKTPMYELALRAFLPSNHAADNSSDKRA